MDNSPMYDDASCRGAKAGAACGGWNCTAAGQCGSFVDGTAGQDGLMQLYAACPAHSPPKGNRGSPH